LQNFVNKNLISGAIGMSFQLRISAEQVLIYYFCKTILLIIDFCQANNLAKLSFTEYRIIIDTAKQKFKSTMERLLFRKEEQKWLKD